MTEPANAEEFEGDKLNVNFSRAQGLKPDGITRIGGIFNPGKMKLAPGDVICRFGNKKRPEADDRCGPWWMLRSTLELNAEHAPDVDALIRTLRQNLALPPAYSPLDRVFMATVRTRLLVFAGNGSAIWRDDLDQNQRDGAPPLLAGGIERDGSARGVSLRFQLFLPGLAASGRDALDYAPVLTAASWFGRFKQGNLDI